MDNNHKTLVWLKNFGEENRFQELPGDSELEECKNRVRESYNYIQLHSSYVILRPNDGVIMGALNFEACLHRRTVGMTGRRISVKLKCLTADQRQRICCGASQISADPSPPFGK